MTVDTILGLIDDIYEAGTRPEHWDAALLRIADATGSAEATMGTHTPAQVQIILSARTDPHYVSSYGQYYHSRNPIQLANNALPIGKVVVNDMIVDSDHFHASEFYNDWCRPQRIHTGGSINLAAEGGWRAAIMFSGAQQYEADALKLLNALAPHLCRAFQLNQVLHDTRELGLSAMLALEHADKGVIIVNRHGQARAANAVAERILARNDGLYLRDGMLAATTSLETKAIERAVSRCERGVVEASGASLLVSRSHGHGPLSLLFAPYPAADIWRGFERQSALVFVTDPDARLEQQLRKMRERYGLTLAEGALVLEIVRSGGRQGAAINRGISIATARTQLTSVFDKTGVRRQAELVRLFLDDGAG